MATYASLKYDFGAQLSGEIPAASIADNAITLAKMASGTDGNILSYDASGNPVAIATGSADQVLTSAGAGAPPTMSAAAGGGMQSMQTFVSSGTTQTATTWTKPAGIKSVLVKLVGGGASNSNQGEGPGAGGYSEKFIDVTNISSETVTVAGAPAANNPGQTTSFGSHCSATGGAEASTTGNGGIGGIGTGGDFNLRGGAGECDYTGTTNNSSAGAPSYFGGGMGGTRTAPNSTVVNAGGAYGAAGGAVANGYTAMALIHGGCCLVYEYK